ncbi:MAG: helix-hairpin-helix domain-containing protein [Bacteroidales bacterium]
MRFIRDFFDLSRSERRATLILSVLIFLVIIIRFAAPERKVPLEYYSLSVNGLLPADSSDSTGWEDQSIEPGKNFQASQGLGSGKAMIDLNLADSMELVRLPGIGPVLASRIIKYRNLLGGYVSTSQLGEVYGITDSLCRRLLPVLTADTSAVRKIYINIPGFDRSLRHPYISKDEADAINELRGSGYFFKSVDDLVDKNIFSREKARKLKCYIDFSEGF